uniref:Dynein light chain Tctex-type 2B n=1 Tax=Ovis aries TaxID=9940 RepID=A0AC11EEC4_SHEEP
MSVAASFPKRASFAAADGLPETENNAGEPENTYILRPIFQQRFRPSVVKDCIHAVLKEELANAEYSPEEMPQLTKHLSENIKDKLKEMGFDRYKMVVQVVIGEQRGEGVFMAARCFWDADTDNCTHDVFMNAPRSKGFSKQEYWSVLPFPSPGDLPNPGIEPVSLRSPALAGEFFTTSAIWE